MKKILYAVSLSLLSLAVLAACQNTGGSAQSGAAQTAQLASEPVLQISTGKEQQTWSLSALSAHPARQTVQTPDDPAYHQPSQWQAVPLRALLPTLKAGGHTQFKASDGFVATIADDTLLSAATPWIAFETAAKPWPALGAGKPSAGPFYLIWTDAARGNISQEQWPYQIASVAPVQSLTERFPALLPAASAPLKEQALRGLQAYSRHCSVCHTLNKAGDASIGPDLNLPHNPTEYFQDKMLRQLIRDPASVRTWPQQSMPGFSKEVLPEAELDDLLVYLKQMAAQR